MTRPLMRKDLKRSLPKEQKQLQPTVKSSQAFLRHQHRLRRDRLQRAVSGTRHLCRVLLRKSLEIHTSRSFRYLHLPSLVLLLQPRHHRLCLRRNHSRLHHQHLKSFHQPTRSIALHNRKPRNRSPKHTPVPNLAGVLRKMSGLLPNQTRKTRVTMEKMLRLADPPSIWHQSYSVPWLHPDRYQQWIASPQRQCKTVRQCRAFSNPVRQCLHHHHRRRRYLIWVRRHRRRQCPDLQHHHRRRCPIVLRLVDRRHGRLVVVEEGHLR
jgi:hypothetical protein